VSLYTIYITPDTFQEIKNLPGNIKQRVKQIIRELGDNPRLSNSKILDVPNIEPELWRLRIDNWRIIYAITEADKIVDVIAVRKRPPYNYEDLQTLLDDLEEQ
jgi:mRNA interferase RelE/StbE